jgi:hypothetical protein
VFDAEGREYLEVNPDYDLETNPDVSEMLPKEVPYNSKVRLKFKLGNAHPVHGVATYLEAVKVLEEAEILESESADF